MLFKIIIKLIQLPKPVSSKTQQYNNYEGWIYFKAFTPLDWVSFS